MNEITKEQAMAIAIALFPYDAAQTRDSGSFISPAIRGWAKQRLEKIAQEVMDASSLFLQSRR